MVRAGQQLALSNLKLLLKVFISLPEHLDLALEAVSIAFQPAFALSAAAFDFIQLSAQRLHLLLQFSHSNVTHTRPVLCSLLQLQRHPMHVRH